MWSTHQSTKAKVFTLTIQPYSDDCEEVPIRGTCTRKSLEATRLPPSSFAGSERASSSEVQASFEGCRALSFCPQNPTRSMPCEERSCVKSDLGDSASKPNCSCLTWPQIFFSRLEDCISANHMARILIWRTCRISLTSRKHLQYVYAHVHVCTMCLKYVPYDWLKYWGMAILVCRRKKSPPAPS